MSNVHDLAGVGGWVVGTGEGLPYVSIYCLYCSVQAKKKVSSSITHNHSLANFLRKVQLYMGKTRLSQNPFITPATATAHAPCPTGNTSRHQAAATWGGEISGAGQRDPRSLLPGRLLMVQLYLALLCHGLSER